VQPLPVQVGAVSRVIVQAPAPVQPVTDAIQKIVRFGFVAVDRFIDDWVAPGVVTMPVKFVLVSRATELTAVVHTASVPDTQFVGHVVSVPPELAAKAPFAVMST